MVVVGAGWIGSEFAASARQRGLEVTVVDPLALPNERIFGPEIGSFYRDVHAEHGVELVLGDGVEALRRRRGRERRCEPAAGARSTATSSSSGSASRPAPSSPAAPASTSTTASSSTRSSRRRRRTCSRPATSPAPGTRSTASEFASSTGRTRSTRARPRRARCSAKPTSYDRIPYFFSDQYDVGMEYSGYAPKWDEVVFRGDRASGEFIAFWLKDQRVVAGMNVNVWDVNEHIQALIRSRRPIQAGRTERPRHTARIARRAIRLG